MGKRYINHSRKERHIVKLIDIMRACERDVKALWKLTKGRQFIRDVRLQNEAALMTRGIAIKLSTIRASEAFNEGNEARFEEIIQSLAQIYGSMYNRVPVDVKLDVGATLEEIIKTAEARRRG